MNSHKQSYINYQYIELSIYLIPILKKKLPQDISTVKYVTLIPLFYFILLFYNNILTIIFLRILIKNINLSN